MIRTGPTALGGTDPQSDSRSCTNTVRSGDISGSLRRIMEAKLGKGVSKPLVCHPSSCWLIYILNFICEQGAASAYRAQAKDHWEDIKYGNLLPVRRHPLLEEEGNRDLDSGRSTVHLIRVMRVNLKLPGIWANPSGNSIEPSVP